MERSMDFTEMLLDLKLCRKVLVATDPRASLVVATDAQVESAALIRDPESLERFG